MTNQFKKTSKATNAFGFSLIEVLVALGIITSVLLVLTSSWSANFRRVRKAKIQTQVVYLLQKKMVEIETLYQNRPQDLPTDPQTGNFGDDHKKYTFSWEAREFKMPDMSSVLTTQSGGADEITLVVINKMKEYFEAAVKEVSLTVTYKQSPKAKEKKYSLSTLFVDYNAAIDLGIDPSVLQGLGGG